MNRFGNGFPANVLASMRHFNDSVAILNSRQRYFVNKSYFQDDVTIAKLMKNSGRYLAECKYEFSSYYEQPARHVISLGESIKVTQGCPEDIKKNIEAVIKEIASSIDELWKQIHRKIIEGYRLQHHRLTEKPHILTKR